MKKLLLLGGIRYLIPVIECAKSLGIYTITCDYLPDNIAHKYSDEYHNISITDVEALIKLGKELEIDGIMSFGVDPGVLPAAKVAKALGLPMPGPIESIEILQNKALFRAFLTQHNFTVPVAKGYDNIEVALEDINRFEFPIIVKPVDAAGSKGVTRVDNLEELRNAIKMAISFSLSNSFIIEEFIEKEGCSSDSDCMSINGELSFISFSAQQFDANSPNPYTPSAYSWPSTFNANQEKELSAELQRLIRLLKLETSLYNVETRVDKTGKAFIMEVAPRGGGNRLSEMLQFISDAPIIENAILAAIGMPLKPLKPLKINGHWSMRVLFSNKAGVFDSIELSDEIKNHVYQTDLWVAKGDVVEAFTAANKTIGTMVFSFDSEKEMERIMSNIEDHVKIIVL